MSKLQRLVSNAKEIIDEFIENSDDDEVSQVLKLLQDHNNKISKCSTCSSTNWRQNLY